MTDRAFDTNREAISVDAKMKHLEFIQSIINRMAANSFLIKGWSVTLTGALVALSAKDARVAFTAIAFFPAFIFWGLDASYLRQERLFRKMYDEVRSKPVEDIDFSLNTQAYQADTASWLATFFELELVLFYGVVLVSILLIMALVHFNG